MTDAPTRIVGWKAIAAHFQRDRSTVIRWAEAGDFPVHRLSGRKGASVWAYAHELDAWLTRSEAPAPDANVAVQQPYRPRWAIAAVTIVFMAAGAADLVLNHIPAAAPGRPTLAMPHDPAVREIYLQARDDWSTRTPAGLRKSIAEFGQVTSREPGFASGYTGLAEAYLLARQYDSVPMPVAFASARAAAKAALAIDPNSAAAERDLGFIAYWEQTDAVDARRHFDRAIRLAPNDAQTPYWYANMLFYAGARAQALDEFRVARFLDPGSLPIQADYAWSVWNAGPGDPGLARLQEIADQAPRLSQVHRWLS